MIRNDIEPGYQITLENRYVFRVIHVPNKNYIMQVGSHYAMIELGDLCNEDLTPKPGTSAILEIKDLKNNVVWTKPVEMTIAEIEKVLKLTPGSLRIKDYDRSISDN